jgi:ABC-type nitrate/sulfonate/bicarbonate transport system permease component
MSARALPAALHLISRLLPFALFLAAWQTMAKSGLVEATFLPSVGAVPARSLISAPAGRSMPISP